jgi:DNA repair protein RecN (Recombination protein N)
VLHAGSEMTSIFDEIDTGTGGAVAEAIGVRLKQLAAGGQVMVVTHAPQVAALASHHLFIRKGGTKAVTTQVEVLDVAARREELARMLSGATISDEARNAAAKLLQEAV